MTEVTLYDGTKWFLPEKIKVNLDIVLNDVKYSEMDLVIVIDGKEGLGKSFASRGLAKYCATKLNSKFSVNDIYFDTDEYINGSLEAGSAEDTGVHKINVLDEGRNALNRLRSNSRKSVKFTNYLSECRALGQVHIILAPAYHDLDAYLINWRMSFVIHFKKNYIKDESTDLGVKIKRGQFLLFTDKKFLSYYYFKKYDYPKKWEANDWWSVHEVFSGEELQAYKAKKNQATIDKYKVEKENEDFVDLAEGFVKATRVARFLGISSSAVKDRIKCGEIPGFSDGKAWYVKKQYVEKIKNMDLVDSRTFHNNKVLVKEGVDGQ